MEDAAEDIAASALLAISAFIALAFSLSFSIVFIAAAFSDFMSTEGIAFSDFADSAAIVDAGIGAALPADAAWTVAALPRSVAVNTSESNFFFIDKVFHCVKVASLTPKKLTLNAQ